MAAKLWCEYQGEDDKGIYCMAHLHEGRVFNCRYKESDLRDVGGTVLPRKPPRTRWDGVCRDYEPKKTDGL